MAKLTQCIVCNSIHKEAVDDMLLNRVPYSVIVKFLYDKGGLVISEQSISRHKKNHLMTNKKPRQIQKQKIKNAQNRAKGNGTLPPNKQMAKTQQVVNSRRPAPSTPLDQKRQAKSYENELAKMEQDIDVIRELTFVLAVSKDRIEKGIQEEEDTGMVLSTTGNALKDYSKALKDFHDITAGMESITKLRYAQLAQMLSNVFASNELSDQTRKELLDLMMAENVVVDVSDADDDTTTPAGNDDEYDDIDSNQYN